MNHSAVDVMGFAGGFTLGMVQAGFTLTGKRELPGGFGVANCEVNRHLLGHDWQTQVGPAETWDATDTDVVFGNPPCSAWSVMTSKSAKGAGAKVTSCMWQFVEYAARVRPWVAVFESVQQAFRNPDGLALMRALRARLEELTGDRYELHHVLHNAYAVGGPAQRRRYFWVASRVPFGVEPVDLDHLPLLNEIIEDLAPLHNTWDAQPYLAPASRWVTREKILSASGTVDGHVFVDNPLTRRIRDLLAAVSWGPGEHIAQVARRHWDEYARLPESFAETEEKIVKKDFHMGYTTPVRWRGDQPARVITGGAGVMVLHPWLPRTITHREAARVMGFPDDWLLAPLRGQPGLFMTHGKGITVQCGRWIGEWIRRSLDGEPGSVTGGRFGERERVIDLTNDWQRSATGRSLNCDTINLANNIVNRPDTKRKDHIMAQPESASPMPAPTPETTTSSASESDGGRGRGRPRPQETIDRDQKVHDAITRPMTKGEIEQATELSSAQVYLSLYRLRKDEKVRRERDGGKHVWVRADVTVSA